MRKIHNLYSSPNIITITKSRRTRWAVQVAHTGEKKVHIEFSCESLKERDHCKDANVGGRIILKWSLEKQDEGEDRIHLAQLWAPANIVMNFRELPEWLSNWRHLQKDLAPLNFLHVCIYLRLLL
jgi:hypothetical protein